MLFEWGDLFAILILLIANFFIIQFLSYFLSFNKKLRNGLLIFLNLSFVFLLFFPEFFGKGLFWKYYYISIMVTFGFLIYLSLMGFLFQAVIWVFKPKKIKLLRNVCLLTALFLFVLGVYQSYIPKIKEVSLNLANVSETKKIAVLADQHLGYIYTPRSLERNVNLINSLDPDLIIIPGDLFNGNYYNLEEFKEPLDDLRAKHGIYFVMGNHDFEIWGERVVDFLNQTDINILRNEAVVVDKLEIIGFDYTEDDIEKEDIKNLQEESDYARILINHTPTHRELARQLDVNLQISGHTHRGQFFPFSVLTQLAYGSYYYDLTEEGDYNIYTSGGAGSWGPPIRTFNQAEIDLITIN